MVISVCRMGAIKTILESIYPYFRGEKKHRARIMLDYIIRRLRFLDTKGKCLLDEFDIDTIKSFYKETGREFKAEEYGILNDYPNTGVRPSGRKRTGRAYTRQDIV